MTTFYHGSSALFDKFDLAHVLEVDGKVKFGYGVSNKNIYQDRWFIVNLKNHLVTFWSPFLGRIIKRLYYMEALFHNISELCLIAPNFHVSVLGTRKER